MYKVDLIKKEERLKVPVRPIEFTRWKEKNDLYYLISRYCNRPAYFWFNYQWSVPVGDERVSMNSPETVDQGWFMEICRELASGTVDPQAWCDANSSLSSKINHELTIKSIGVFDEGFCSCGWKSENYMDGREYIEDDWGKHVKQQRNK